jgi:hypothetical protein
LLGKFGVKLIPTNPLVRKTFVRRTRASNLQ